MRCREFFFLFLFLCSALACIKAFTHNKRTNAIQPKSQVVDKFGGVKLLTLGKALVACRTWASNYFYVVVLLKQTSNRSGFRVPWIDVPCTDMHQHASESLLREKGDAFKFTHDLMPIPGALPRLPWVNYQCMPAKSKQGNALKFTHNLVIFFGDVSRFTRVHPGLTSWSMPVLASEESRHWKNCL